jgi:hypothetical protein
MRARRAGRAQRLEDHFQPTFLRLAQRRGQRAGNPRLSECRLPRLAGILAHARDDDGAQFGDGAQSTRPDLFRRRIAGRAQRVERAQHSVVPLGQRHGDRTRGADDLARPRQRQARLHEVGVVLLCAHLHYDVTDGRANVRSVDSYKSIRAVTNYDTLCRLFHHPVRLII